jgi:hypothetical protein
LITDQPSNRLQKEKMRVLSSGVLMLALLTPLLAERQIHGALTADGWCDNDPPGNAISAPGTFRRRAEQGDGTYNNPSTCAADPNRAAYGTKIYISHLRKYCAVEDWCAA